jgi:multidrug resistance efflux pump
LETKKDVMPINETFKSSFRSENVQEIISHKPGFMEKWSLWIFLVILTFFFWGTWFVKYPDIVQTNAILTADNAPKEIISRQEGKIIQLFVSNETIVARGQMIAWIESIADHSQVIKLSQCLNSSIDLLGKNQTEKVSAIFRKEFQNLGELQPAYQTFIVAWQQFNDYLSNGYYFKRKKSLYEDELYLQKMHTTIEQQMDLVTKDLKLTQEAIDANNSLLKDKVISQQDMREMKSKLFGKQMTLPQLESSLLTNEIAQADKIKEINELEHTISQQKMIYQQASQTLKSLIDEWKRKYIISSPVDGKIAFIVPLQENQFLQSGKLIGYVNPPDSRYYAMVTLTQNNFGKIIPGQKVQMRFDAYPYQEFGYVEGKLDYISKVPSDSGFLATIELSKGLKTNYDINIQYRNGLKSQALIITKDTRLLDRFYYNVIKGIHR